MPRRSRTVITKDLAIAISKKLQANVSRKKNRPHDLCQVFYRGIMIVQFGIRRSSRGNEGHDHVPREIHLPQQKAKLLGQCPMSRDEWIEEMKRINLIPPEEELPEPSDKPS